MPKYIAFLRAINVGGRTVKMDVLKEYIAMPGFEQISTYIQSGNVIFEHKSKDVKKLEVAIAIQLKEKLMVLMEHELIILIILLLLIGLINIEMKIMAHL